MKFLFENDWSTGAPFKLPNQVCLSPRRRLRRARFPRITGLAAVIEHQQPFRHCRSDRRTAPAPASPSNRINVAPIASSPHLPPLFALHRARARRRRRLQAALRARELLLLYALVLRILPTIADRMHPARSCVRVLLRHRSAGLAKHERYKGLARGGVCAAAV
jgi:hypothetical protein